MDQYQARKQWPLFAKISLGALAGLVGISLILILMSISCVPVGHYGVVDVFGSARDVPLVNGFNIFVNPFGRVSKLPVRTNELKEEDFNITTKEGLAVLLDLSVWWKCDAQRVVEVYRNLGPNYIETIIHPAVRGMVRDAISKYPCDNLYHQESRKEAVDAAMNLLNAELMPRGIIVEKVLLRNIEFPPDVKKAIDTKMAMKYQAEQMEFVIQKETQEANRKAIEAEGIAKAQHIIAQSLTNEYLQWKYIEALKDTVHSPNHSTVILPMDTKLVPMMDVTRSRSVEQK